LGNGIIQVYGFNGTDLSTIGAPLTPPISSQITSLKWCGDCHYLAAVNVFDYLYVYTFDGYSLTGPIISASHSLNAAIDWCGTCSYIAAGGIDTVSGLGIVNIYEFNGTSLSFTTSASIPAPINGSKVTSLAWCQGCDNLAAAGFIIDSGGNQTGFVKLYHFDESKKTLSLSQTYTFSKDFLAFSPITVDWCGSNCCYLAAGGRAGIFPNYTGIIQLFKGNSCLLPAPSNLSAQKIYRRFPTQVDIINKICWDAVTDAVAYNVYADANLSILLATITTAPLCYSQHQICSLLRQGFGGQEGKSATYYVTAVDVNGTPSLPAAVTI